MPQIGLAASGLEAKTDPVGAMVASRSLPR